MSENKKTNQVVQSSIKEGGAPPVTVGDSNLDICARALTRALAEIEKRSLQSCGYILPWEKDIQDEEGAKKSVPADFRARWQSLRDSLRPSLKTAETSKLIGLVNILDPKFVEELNKTVNVNEENVNFWAVLVASLRYVNGQEVLFWSVPAEVRQFKQTLMGLFCFLGGDRFNALLPSGLECAKDDSGAWLPALTGDSVAQLIKTYGLKIEGRPLTIQGIRKDGAIVKKNLYF